MARVFDAHKVSQSLCLQLGNWARLVIPFKSPEGATCYHVIRLSKLGHCLLSKKEAVTHWKMTGCAGVTQGALVELVPTAHYGEGPH